MPGFVAAVQPSITVPISLTHLYYICFLAGFAISATIYCVLHLTCPAHASKQFVEESPSARALMRKYQERRDGESSEFVSDVDKDKDAGVATSREVNS
jgi:NCS1 family nucleobase:cation symporter-1